MDNYVLAQSWARANVQDRLWYCMTDADKTALAQNENIVFGDKVYIISTKQIFIMGNDRIPINMAAAVVETPEPVATS